VTDPDGQLTATLTEAALGYPGAVEDFPWGDRVAKVNGKIFAFLGSSHRDGPTVSVKIPESAPTALALSSCESTGYGLGRAGWVTVHLDHAECPDEDLLLEWIDESYRTVAPKRLIAELDLLT
jgi:predicted DNA-binding protein (MmcQ/YjbR family)